MEPRELIHQYLLGSLGEEDVGHLDRMLAKDQQLRKEFLQITNIDAALRETAIEESFHESQQHGAADGNSIVLSQLGRGLSWFAACVGLAACTLIAVGIWMRQPATVATLTSSEQAAWVSALPTSLGSQLTRGTLDLKAGIATLRFHSGAEMTIEAPAKVELVSTMKAKLDKGAAVLNVPDSAKGFVLETPDGYAVDFGTQFAVTIDSALNKSDFELIEGEIEVHQPNTGKSLRLSTVGAAASVSTDSLELVEDPLSGQSTPVGDRPAEEVIRVSTEGRCLVALHNERRRDKAIKSGYLYASHTQNGKWDMRSYIGFDLADVKIEDVVSARLRLNQVESYRGSAALLPKVNRFALYGLTNSQALDWDAEPAWATAPTAEDGVFVGTFELPRSTMRGTIEIESNELLSFVREHGNELVTFVLVRESGRIEGTGPAMPHMFANDKHPEAVGPLLELRMKQAQAFVEQ